MNEPHPSPERTPPRRGFFQQLFRWATCATGAVAAAAVGVPFVGYLFGPLRKNPDNGSLWVRWTTSDLVGETRLHTFLNPLGKPWDGKAAQTGVYVRNLGPDKPEKQQFLVFAVNCAHLGCPVSWFPQSGLFMCPCHGGVYYASGDRASGPPPRGLFRCDWRIRSGRLEVQAPHYPTLQDPLRREDRP